MISVVSPFISLETDPFSDIDSCDLEEVDDAGSGELTELIHCVHGSETYIPCLAHHCSRHKAPLQLLQLRISREESKLHESRDVSSTVVLHRPSEPLELVSPRPLQPCQRHLVLMNN